MTAETLNRILFTSYKAGRIDAMLDVIKLLRAVDFSDGLPEELAIKAGKLNGAQAIVRGASTMAEAMADWIEETVEVDKKQDLGPEQKEKAEKMAQMILDITGL